MGVLLMPHQREAIEKLHSGSILCGGVGTGKSLTALGYYFLQECKGVEWSNCAKGPMMEPKPLYIITTAKKRDSKEWDSDIDKFGLDRGEVKIVIDSWNNIQKYMEVYGAFFIFDEQRVGGSGKWSKCFCKLAKRNHWLLLTATPGDTWLDYIPVFVANGFYKNRSEFLRRHVVYSPYVTKFPKIDRFIEVGYLEKLRRSITVVMKFKKKTTPIWETVVDERYDKDKYDIVWRKRWDPWKNEPIKDISGCCYLLRKVVNLNEARCRQVFMLAMGSKKHRAIVFYNFDYELLLLKDYIDQRVGEIMEDEDKAEQFDILYGDFAIAEWNGHKHEPIPDTRSWIYLVQYNAGAEGWNCIETDTVIFYSQNYSYKAMTQAAGRIDRMNTEFDELHYYVMRSNAPIDMAITNALNGKKNFNEQIFWSDEQIKDLKKIRRK